VTANVRDQPQSAAECGDGTRQCLYFRHLAELDLRDPAWSNAMSSARPAWVKPKPLALLGELTAPLISRDRPTAERN
jgi:hypothetical protein